MEKEKMTDMIDYVIDNFYQEITVKSSQERYLQFFETIVERTAKLAALW
jgi:uncharacterized protein YdiU (UPF0061 family)